MIAAMSDRQRHWLWAIVLTGAALRFYPIWFGLPYLTARPDEETAIGQALGMLDGDLNPEFFHWPSLTLYAFAALFKITSSIRQSLSLDPPLTYEASMLLARGFVALAGTATIVVLFRLGRRVADPTVGLLAALFLTVAILHVRDSHFAMTDVLMTLLVTSSLVLLLRATDAAIAERLPPARLLQWFAAAGLAGGLAASTKYSAAAIVAAMGAAQLLLLRHATPSVASVRAWAPSIAFVAALVAGFLAATPYAVLDFATFERDVRFTVTHLSAGHGVDLGRGWTYHISRSLPFGLGPATFIAATAGVVPLVKHHPRHAFVIGTFAAAFYVSIGSGQTVFFRYVMPLLPLACLSAALAVRHMAPWLARRTGLSTGVATATLAVLIVAPSAVNSVWFDVVLAKTDTRVLAARWLESRLDPETTLYDGGGPYAQLDLRHVRFHQWYFDPVTGSFGDPEGRTPEWLVLHESPLRVYSTVPAVIRQLAQQKYALVQTFTATTGRSRWAVYDPQDAFFMPFSGFHTIERPGPTIRIYRRLPPARI